MLSAFYAEKVEYLLVGAYAMAAHGVPRATGDIDLWIRPTPENASKVLSALKVFGAPLSDVTANDFSSPGITYQIGIAPSRIDVLTAIDGVTFDEAWAERIDTQIAGLSVPVIGRNSLIKNKRASGRPKDLADVAWLEGND